MKQIIKKFTGLIALRDLDSKPESFDVTLNNLDLLKSYSSFECTFFMYPYDKGLNANYFNLSPYEEYVKDVNMGRRSMYGKLDNIGDNIFGFILGFTILFFFWIFNRREIFSIEAVVSIFAAYAIGKELWNDFDNGLTNWTQNWKLSWRDNSHYYIKQDFGSIQKFWKVARQEKYQHDTLLAKKIDFLSYSNSKTVELLFHRKDLKDISQENINLVVINFDEGIAVKKDNFMFGAKITLTKNILFWKTNTELFQSVSKGQLGAVDKNDHWHEDKVLVRKTVNVGRVKFYWRSGMGEGELISLPVG
jgi:hypothetical protein